MAVGAVVVGASVASAADDARGRALFGQCAQCHGPQGAGQRMALAPAIAGLETWYIEAQLKKFRSGVRGAHPDDVAGMRMHPMAVWLKTDEDITAVAAYVASLPDPVPQPTLTEGDPNRGKALYATCAACHGAQARGNQAVNGPSLVATNDWYLETTLQKYKAGIRGGNPQDQLGALMRSMAGTLPDNQAIVDVIAYIATLR
jgi:cytochrome c553